MSGAVLGFDRSPGRSGSDRKLVKQTWVLRKPREVGGPWVGLLEMINTRAAAPSPIITFRHLRCAGDEQDSWVLISADAADFP